MTLLNSKIIIKHNWEILTFAIFKKLRFPKKNLKMVKNTQNLSKKLFLPLKYLILLTFQVKNQKKWSCFSQTFHMESPLRKGVRTNKIMVQSSSFLKEEKSIFLATSFF